MVMFVEERRDAQGVLQKHVHVTPITSTITAMLQNASSPPEPGHNVRQRSRQRTCQMRLYPATISYAPEQTQTDASVEENAELKLNPDETRF